MKKIPFLLLVFLPVIILGQTNSENYVKSTTYTAETDIQNHKIDSITYFDGLGRPKQIRALKAGGDGQDIITPITYDEFGRHPKQYLPYADPNQTPEGSSPGYSDNTTVIIPALKQYYTDKFPDEIDQNAPNPYTEKIYDGSPLDRVVEQGAPGESWKPSANGNSGHTVKMAYLTNTSSDQVKHFKVTFPETDQFVKTNLSYTGSYSPHQLYKTIVKDENWQPSQAHPKDHTTEQFKDQQGRLILKRTFDQGENLDTYYVYDRYGNLTYVIPPKAVNSLVNVVDLDIQNHLFTYSWPHLVKVDKAFAEEYDRKLKDYEDQDILNADVENKYGGQGGFTLSTQEDNQNLELGISFSADHPFSLKTGEITSLKTYGRFKDTELGHIKGEGYNYYILIRNNALVIEGEGKIASLNKTFNSSSKLSYSRNYPWTAYADVDPKFAEEYKESLGGYPNSDILNVDIPNPYNGQGGLNISIDEEDNITVNINSSSTTPLSLKKGLAIPLPAKRRIPDQELGEISGNGYHYTFAIRENNLAIEGRGTLSDINVLFSHIYIYTHQIDQPTLNGLCYIYHYNHRNRVVEKKIPGKGWQYIVYDKLDRPVLTQDAKLRQNNEWLFKKYDAFDRPVYTGKYHFTFVRSPKDPGTDHSHIIGRAEMQTAVKTMPLNETKRSIAHGPVQIGDADLYYTNASHPYIDFTNRNPVVLTINYYDDYQSPPWLGNGPMNFSTTGLQTGQRIRVLGTDQWIRTVTKYDPKGRPTTVNTTNPFLATDHNTLTTYNFMDNPVRIQNTQTKDAGTVTTVDTLTYDHMQRPLSQIRSINGGAKEHITKNSYDELGQRKTKAVGGQYLTLNGLNQGMGGNWGTLSLALQTVSYTYNIRGWLTGINDPDDLGSDLFALAIAYENPQANATPLYNGNISRVHWRTANDADDGTNVSRAYTYSYDALSRIKAANYTTLGQPNVLRYYDLSNVDYDKNGNITALQRWGKPTDGPQTSNDIIDQLDYHYQPKSNKLLEVGDDAWSQGTIGGAGSYGFKDGNTSGNDYAYDANGNMTQDLNKDLLNISYNHLNLPDTLTFINNNSIVYAFTADGTKLKKTVHDNSTTTTTEYDHGFIYKNGSLKFFAQPEGYVEPNGNGGFTYVYQYKDQLGNIRLSYKNTGSASHHQLSIVEENNYYPFGLKHQGYNNVVSGEEYKYKTYQGQELNDELGLNWLSFKYRNYDPAIGRFMSVDPLATKYPYNGVYNFSENRVIDGVELEGLEWENFMSGFKDPKDLKVQSPSSDAQKQSYNVTTSGNTKSLGQIKNSFKKNPGSILNNLSANFKQIDGKGNKIKNGSISKGSYLKINIDGPLNNSVVKVIGSKSSDNGFSYTFGTLEGHVEKGVITFGVSANDDGTMSFSINSTSEQNNGTINFLGLGDATRVKQKESWKEVLTNFVEFSGGSEQSRSLKVDGNSESATDNSRRIRRMNEQPKYKRFGEN